MHNNIDSASRAYMAEQYCKSVSTTQCHTKSFYECPNNAKM